MTRQPPLGPDDARQPDRLDAFLDGLTNGRTIPPRDLDPTLAATVRHVHGLASESVANDLDRVGKAQRWEHLMQNQNRIARSTVTSFPTATLPSSSFPAPVPLRPAAQQSRLRRLGGQSLGLVATLTLVLLVAASGLAVYLTAPQGGGHPTMFPAAFGASAEATPQMSQGDRFAIYRDTYPDLAVPFLTTCDVQPRSLEELTRILGTPIEPDREGTPRLFLEPSAPRPSFLPSDLVGPSPDGTGATPTGTPITTDTRAAITATWGRYRSCELSHEQRRASVYMSDNALLRLVYRDRGDLIAIAALSADIRDVNLLADFNQEDNGGLVDFRMVSPDRVMATILIEREFMDTGPGVEVNGYVAFVFQNGVWLVDDVIRLLG